MTSASQYAKAWARATRRKMKTKVGITLVYEALAAHCCHMSFHSWTADQFKIPEDFEATMLRVRVVGLGYPVELANELLKAVQSAWDENPFAGRTPAITLDYLIQKAANGEGQEKLTDEQQLMLYRVLCSGCRQPTKQNVIRRLDLPLSVWPGRAIFRQVIFKDGYVDICASQCYTGTVREIREAILNH